jgi:hypothetical protein
MIPFPRKPRSVTGSVRRLGEFDDGKKIDSVSGAFFGHLSWMVLSLWKAISAVESDPGRNNGYRSGDGIPDPPGSVIFVAAQPIC